MIRPAPSDRVGDRRKRPRPRSDIKECLLEIGVPPEKHSLDGLSGYFPAELKIDESDFDVDVLAEVLIHLVQARIIRIAPI